MKRTNSFFIFLILIFFDINVSFSNDYIINKVEITKIKEFLLLILLTLQINILMIKY